MLLKAKANKVIALLCVLAMAITLIIPSGFSLPRASAAAATAPDGASSAAEIKKDTVFMYNFCDGSVVPADATPFADKFESADGVFTLVNKSGKFAWKDKSHGLTLTGSDAIEVKVAGDSIVTFTLCSTSGDAAPTITASSTVGKFVGEVTKSFVGEAEKGDGASVAAFEYEGPAATLTFTVTAAGLTYLHAMHVSNKPETTNPPVAAGNGKIDAWDFGAEELDTKTYNNKLNVDIINGFYPSSVTGGSSGKQIGSFKTDEIIFNGSGKTNNRIRTENKAITRHDEKSLKIDGTTYNGYVYSNSGSSPSIYLGIKLYEGDILTVYAGGNNGPSTIICQSPTGEIQTGSALKAGSKLTFNATEYGVYKLYSKDEKLIIARLLREHPTPVKVSGSVDVTEAQGIGNDYKLSFTNKTTGEVTEADVADGKYSVYLFDSYSYDIAVVNATGYVVGGNKTLAVEKGKGDVDNKVKIVKVDLVNITGKITDLPENEIKKLEIILENKDKIYAPEVKLDNTTGEYSVALEKGVSYKVIANGVNDYDFVDASKTISATADGKIDIKFAKKPVYDVNVTYKGLSDPAKANVTLTFTNLNEEGYVYTFKPGEAPKLRDGVYSVKVTDMADAVAQKLTSNVVVNGKAADKEITFVAIDAWDFGKLCPDNNVVTIGETKYFLGLQLVGNAKEDQNKQIFIGKDGELKIPVKKDQLVSFDYYYEAAFEAGGKKILSNSKDTSKFEYTATEDGFFTIKGIEGTLDDNKTVVNKTYIKKITIATPVEYKAKITVGKDKEYQTINDALAAVAKMDRPNGVRVEIVIDPGNYEEMLVINVPNVSLKNAAGKDSSLSIIDKGVNIGKNVVRITSYYGHGYNYYSMNAGCKWDADVLAANKENGSISKKNPGSGKNPGPNPTDGSYWNSTVVVFGEGFEADGIVFENSFNQYISKKESEDTVVMWETDSKGERPTTVGDTSVQTRSFVERAGAIAIIGDKSVFNNCKFIGRQDTLYGDTVKAVFNKCDILGAVDFIYGPMNAVFYQCKLRMNTDSKTDSDKAYITAAQQKSGRGYLMYECTVTSTTPGVDTASEYRSKPGYFGRPWEANNSEVVFYNTVIETTDHPGSEGKSLIAPEGWGDSLGGKSEKMYEYGTVELSKEDNAASRVEWTTLLTAPVLADNTSISNESFITEEWTKTLEESGYLKGELVADKATGVTVEGVPEGVELVVKPGEKTETTAEFDISLMKDNVAVQPDGKVTVRITIPEEFRGRKVTVSHKEADGKLTEVESKQEGDYVFFTTDHFSVYVLTAEKSGDDSPVTGVMPIVPIAAVIIVAAAAVIFLVIKKRTTK